MRKRRRDANEDQPDQYDQYSDLRVGACWHPATTAHHHCLVCSSHCGSDEHDGPTWSTSQNGSISASASPPPAAASPAATSSPYLLHTFIPGWSGLSHRLGAITIGLVCWLAKQLVTFSSRSLSLLFFALFLCSPSPYLPQQHFLRQLTSSVVHSSSLNLRSISSSSQSILLYSSYYCILFTSATSGSPFVAKAESIQGLSLNSFIPHFEPLYYDRHQLLHQYTRLKRSMAEKKSSKVEQATETQHKTERQRKRTRRRTSGSVVDDGDSDISSATNSRDDLVILAKKNPIVDTTKPPHPPHSSNMSSGDDDEEHGVEGNGNNSLNSTITITSTTAFFRHNCPMPNHEHHTEDSTEKVMLNHRSGDHGHNRTATTRTLSTTSDQAKHSNKPSTSTTSDSWLLQYDSDTHPDETDTDASIDIVDEHDGQVDEDSDDNEHSHSNVIFDSPKEQHIRVTFTAHNRLFRLKLQLNSEHVFAQDPVFESTGNKDFRYDTSNVVRGHLEDDEQAIFDGIITRDGLLDGHLTTRHDEFYIEPADRHYHGHDHEHDFHSVIYSTSVVNFPNATHGSASPYFGSKYLPLMNVPFRGYFDHWLDGLMDEQSDLFNNIEQVLHLNGEHQRKRRRPKRSEPSDSSASSEIVDLNTTDHPSLWSSYVRTNQTFNGSNSDVDFEIHYANNKMSYSSSSVSSSSVSSSSSSSTSTSRIPSKAEHFRKVASKNGITGGVVNIGASSSGGTVVRNVVHTADGHGGRYWRDMDSLHYTESEPYGIKAVHPRTHWIDDQRHHDRHVVVDPKKTTCMLYLQADHLFFEKMGSEEACIESMTRHVQKVNNIYKNTDFDQDGRPDNISFLIKRIKVHTLEALKDPEYRYPSTYGVEKFLELFSEEDYDAFCLAYMFTYRDFEGGTLGLAWTGDLKNAGGVCEKNGHYRGSLKSLNTGIVTLLNYGKHVPPIVSHVTLAHEIGHNFGSPHDPEDDHACTPGGENGNYIMFARATSGDKRNNNKFSPCSLRSINAVLNTKAKSLKGCFQEPQDAICGNEVVEEGEECDCGWEEDCKEPCCFPMRANPPADEPPCRLRPNVICSPSMGPCCTQDCKLKVGNKCRDDNGCRTASYCNGHGPTCPPSTNKANKTICNEEYVCYMGECTGSICMAYGLESCQCKQGPNDPPTKLCELCCRMPSDDSTCKSSFEWNTTPYDVPDLFSKPGTPCENYNGYCDVNQRCREVDPSSPLATLRRLLLSNESMASLKRWFNEQWFYVAVLIMISVLILLMAYKVFNSRRSLRLTKTDIMEVALEAVAKHQQEQAQQQAQQQQQQSSQSSATASTSNGSDSMSQVSSSCGVSQSNKTGSSSANSTSSPTSNTTVNTSSSASTMSTATSSTSSSSSMSLSSTKTTTTSALIATPTSSGSVGHNHATSNNPSASSSTNASLQAKNSIDSQHSLLDHNSANSYGFNGTNSANPMESSYTGTMSSYIPPTNNQTSNNSMQPKVSSSNYAPAVDSSLYGTMKNGHQSYYQSKHSNASSNAVVAAQQASLMADTTNSLYNHPFSPQQGGSLYGYSRGQSNGHHHHHHHSIPSLYQPSMIYQQQQTVVAASAPMGAQQSFYDTSALAIVANQHHQPTYGTTANQAYHHLTAEQTYGQTYYYPANGGRQLSYPAQASTYYQSSLYDYIPFPRPVNPNSATTKPPPLPSMATHPAQIQHQHPTPSSTSTHKNRSMDMANTLDTRRLYSSSLEVPGYKDNNSAYYTDSAVGQSTSDDKNGHHHHHYYYQQLYGNTTANSSSNASSSKFAQHYPTMHRGSTGSSAASLHHHNHLTPGSGTSASSQASRHYQHFYPHQLHASTSAAVSASHHTQGSSGSHSRQHHSSHPQLLNTTSLSVPRASGSGSGATTGATALEPTYGTTSHHTTSGPPSRRSQHQSQIYEPLATLPMTSMGHYGYSQMDHSGHHPNNSIYYSSRSEVFAQHHESLPPMGTLGSSGTGGLHHSNSFHGHLDDFDLINPINSDAASDSNVGMSTGHKHGKSHGSSGWV